MTIQKYLASHKLVVLFIGRDTVVVSSPDS